MHAAAPVSSVAFSVARSRQRCAALPLLRAAGFTAVVSVTATLRIRPITVQVVDVPAEFVPLRYASVMSLTILGVIAATTACFVLHRFARNPVGVFRRVAPVAVALSFIPDIAIWLGDAYQHTANASTVIPLLVMHIAVGALCFAILPRAITEPVRASNEGIASNVAAS